MKNLISTLLTLLLAVGVQAQKLTESHKYTNPTPGKLPILAWFSLTGEQVSKERYEEMAGNGIAAFKLIILKRNQGIGKKPFSPPFCAPVTSM